MCCYYSTEKTGGNAEVFGTIGEKWKGLPESARDSYRKKAADSGYSSVSPPSPNKRAKRIIKNIMKEVIIAT